MRTYSLTRLATDAAKLSHQGRVLFGLLCAERLFPNYVAFSKKYRFGNPAVLRAALDFAWSASGQVQTVPPSLASKVEKNTPDTEDFDTVYVSSALDACTAVVSLLALVSGGGAEVAVEIATVARDTVDMYVQERDTMPANSRALEKMIAEHPLMQDELHAQRLAIEYLASADVLSATEVSDIRKRWGQRRTSNIGIDIDTGIQDDL